LQISKILWLISLLILSGCKEEYPVYSSFDENNITKRVQCLHYIVFEKKRKIYGGFDS